MVSLRPEHPIHELHETDDVATLGCVDHDWVVIVPRTDGPAPDIAKVWSDHHDGVYLERATQNSHTTIYYVDIHQ